MCSCILLLISLLNLLFSFKLSVEKPKDASQFIWRLSTITPALIRETVLRSGFKLIKENSTSTAWIATWCKHLKTFQYADLNSNQKVNHFPGSFNFGRKDRLWSNINSLCVRMRETSDEDAFHPQTYILPNDVKLLKQNWLIKPDLKLILKPPASARGNGELLDDCIFLFKVINLFTFAQESK